MPQLRRMGGLVWFLCSTFHRIKIKVSAAGKSLQQPHSGYQQNPVSYSYLAELPVSLLLSLWGLCLKPPSFHFTSSLHLQITKDVSGPSPGPLWLLHLLHLSDSSLRKFSAFKGSCGYTGPTRVIQDTLPIWRFKSLLTFAKSIFPHNKRYSRGSVHTPLRAVLLPTTCNVH